MSGTPNVVAQVAATLDPSVRQVVAALSAAASAVGDGGMLAVQVETATAWDGQAPPTLASLASLTAAQIAAIGPHVVLAAMLPLLLDLATTTNLAAKRAINLVEGTS